MIRISKLLHQRLLNYLQTLDDEEAQALLKDLEAQAQPAYRTPYGSYTLDYEAATSSYRV